jgi:hypothetical protein
VLAVKPGHLRIESLLMLRMDDLNAGLSRREPLNVRPNVDAIFKMAHIAE